jgi:Icc protein
MTRIGHLADFHLLEEAVHARRGRAHVRVRYLSLARRIDPGERRDRAARALAAARVARLDHLALAGDLTEDGSLAQFEVLRELLEASGLEPERVTIVPGNHDALGAGWEAALAGPLARWRATSAPGAVVVHDGARIVALSTAVRQPFVRSSGRLGGAQLDAVRRVVADSGDDAIVLVQHHPPFRVTHQWVHGLLDHADAHALLVANPRVSVLHGHIHRRRDHALAPGEAPRVFAPEAVSDHDLPLRVFRVRDGVLDPEDAHVGACVPGPIR